MTDLAFSTIRTKAPTAPNPQKTEQLTKISQVFERQLAASGPAGRNSVGFGALGEKMANSDKLIYLDKMEKIPVTICKKAKGSNKSLYREGFISRSDVFKFVQGRHNKSYATPLDFIAERKEEYMSRSSTATKAEKKGILAWEAKEVAPLNYRIKFKRHNIQAEGPSDTAFYFEREDEWKKMMNFLTGVKILETNLGSGQSTFPSILQRLTLAYRAQMAYKFRVAMQKRAQTIKYAINQKDTLVRQTSAVAQFNNRILSTMIRRWAQVANVRDSSKRKQEKEHSDRQTQLSNALRDSLLVTKLNNRVMTLLQEAWKNKAIERIYPNKEDINILFNSLELVSNINRPSIKVEVKMRKDLPEPIKLNGKLLQGKIREFKLKCEEKNTIRKDNAKHWRIFAGPGDISDEQKKFVKESYIPSTLDLSGEKFSLHFEDFSLEQLKNVEIRVSVHDEKNKMRAYYDTSLRVLHLASKKGKNTWLCLSVNEKTDKKYPLLHLKIETKAPRNRKERQELASRQGNFGKTPNTSTIEDTFYDYSFKIPTVTPDHKEFLDLLPPAWGIIDSKPKDSGSSQAQNDFIQRIRYKLSKHYHETTTRQIARLKKNAYIWADLQDDIMSYFPNKELEDRSNLYINEDYLRDVTVRGSVGRSSAHIGRDTGQVVSYLFKRDLWESKVEWRQYYIELERLCKKGIPPQSRLDIWSEMSRVIYFIRLTEELFQNDQALRGTGANAQTFPNEDVPIKSRRVYQMIKDLAQKDYSYLYQELEDDIRALSASFGVKKLAYEKHVRSICRAFICWSKLFSDPSREEHLRYFITYSRTIATLCYGLLVCQTCSFVEGNYGVKENQVFWLLLTLVTYILPSYFETNEHSVGVDTITHKGAEISRRRNTLTNSALRCHQMRGIKSDLLILKFLLRDNQPEIYQKFEELGLPLEYYFGDYMLGLFFTLFNPGLTFRIWDVLFFEGSSSNQVRCNRMIVCFIYTVLKECKSQILKAKDAQDIKFIIELYSRFQTSYGDFIRKSYTFCNENFEQVLPEFDTVLGTLKYIKYALFSNEYNKLDNKLQNVEKLIENHFQPTFHQNDALYKFAKQKIQYKAGANPEVLSYPVLAGIIRKFVAQYGAPTGKAAVNASQDGRKLLREKVSNIWIKVYRMTARPETLKGTVVNLIYGREKLTKKDYDPLAVDFEGTFNLTTMQEGVKREIRLEISDEKDALYPKRLSFVAIDLKSLPVNEVVKLNLRLQEADTEIYNDNYVVSEVELAIVLETQHVEGDPHRAAKRDIQPLLVPELEDASYKEFKGLRLANSTVSRIVSQTGISEETLDRFSVLRRSLSNWKENFAMTYQDFVNAMGAVAPFWSENDLRNAFNTITKANRNNTFYVVDFFVLLILYGLATVNQKCSLLFELFSNFGNDFQSRTEEMSLYTLKGITSYLYDLFMVHIPHNQVDNMVELATTGHASCIKRVVINENTNGSRIEYPKQVLNKLSNYIHLYFNTNDVHVNTPEILRLLRNVYEKEILPTSDRRAALPKNTIDIMYFTEGRNHKMTIYADDSWNPIRDPRIEHLGGEMPKLLGYYNNVLPLNTPSSVITKDQFVNVLQRLPLLNYLCSLENYGVAKSFGLLGSLKYTVLMEGENLYTVKPSFAPLQSQQPEDEYYQPSPRGQKRDKFNAVLRSWPAFVRQATAKLQSPQRNQQAMIYTKSDVITVPVHKLDICLPYSKIMENIKKAIIREISESLNRSWNNTGSYQARLYNENLYSLDFDVGLVVNRSQRFEKINKNISPLLNLMDLIESLSISQEDIKDLEVVFSLRNSTIPDPYIEPFSHLALYRYTDGSSEWLTCRVSYKFHFGGTNNAAPERVDGYGVVFERFPDKTVLRKTSEVIFGEQVDMNELAFKEVDRRTNKAATIDQVPMYMNKSLTFTQGNESPKKKDDNSFGANQYKPNQNVGGNDSRFSPSPYKESDRPV